MISMIGKATLATMVTSAIININMSIAVISITSLRRELPAYRDLSNTSLTSLYVIMIVREHLYYTMLFLFCQVFPFLLTNYKKTPI